MADLTPEQLDALEATAKAATLGPWSWFGNAKMHEVYLATVDRGRIFIMDFVRWGMSGAQPRFRKHGRGMCRLAEMANSGDPHGPIFEAEHRRQFTGINHPDALHIAAASPDVVLQLVAAAKEWNGLAAQLANAEQERDKLRGQIGNLRAAKT